MESRPGRRAVGYVSIRINKRGLRLGDVIIINGVRTTIERVDGLVFYRSHDGGLVKLGPKQDVTKVVFEGDPDVELLTLLGRLKRFRRGPKKTS